MRWLDGITELNGHEFVQTLGDGDGQRSLACCSSWGHIESDTTLRLHNNNQILQTAWLTNNRNSFFTDQESVKSKIKVLADSVSVHRWLSFQWVLM